MLKSGETEDMVKEATLHWLAKQPEDITPGQKVFQDQTYCIDKLIYPLHAPFDEEDECQILLDDHDHNSTAVSERRNSIMSTILSVVCQVWNSDYPSNPNY